MAIEIATSLTVPQSARSTKELPGSASSQASSQVQTAAPIQRAGKAAEAGRMGFKSFEKKADAAKDNQQQTPDYKSLAQLVDMVNERSQIKNRSLQFSVDDSTGKMLVQVYDADTNELIRQFPPDELLVLAERLQEILEGDSSSLILQDKA